MSKFLLDVQIVMLNKDLATDAHPKALITSYYHLGGLKQTKFLVSHIWLGF